MPNTKYTSYTSETQYHKVCQENSTGKHSPHRGNTSTSQKHNFPNLHTKVNNRQGKHGTNNKASQIKNSPTAVYYIN